jgi:hypothetical protein
MAHIFLSYSRADVVETDNLATILGRIGWSVWWDTDLNAGEQWSSETNGVVLAKLQSWAGDFTGRLSLQEEYKGRK